MSRPKGSKNKPKGTVDKKETVETNPVTEVPKVELPPAKDGRALAKIKPSKDFFVDTFEECKIKDYDEGYGPEFQKMIDEQYVKTFEREE